MADGHGAAWHGVDRTGEQWLQKEGRPSAEHITWIEAHSLVKEWAPKLTIEGLGGRLLCRGVLRSGG